MILAKIAMALVAKVTCLRLLTSTAVKCWLLVKCEKGQNSALLRVRNPPQLPKLPSKYFQDGDSCLNALWTPQYLCYLFRFARASFTTFGSLLRQKSGSLIQSLNTGLENPNIFCEIHSIFCKKSKWYWFVRVRWPNKKSKIQISTSDTVSDCRLFFRPQSFTKRTNKNKLF